MKTKIRQLKNQIEQAEEISNKLSLYLELAAELNKTDIPGAIEICQEAIELARLPQHEPNCQEELSRCLFQLGMLKARRGEYLEAISIVYDAMPQIERLNDRYLLARAINVIAAANGYLGNYYESLNHFRRALEIFKEINDHIWETAVMNNIGYQYWNLENYEWALKYLNMSLNQVENFPEKTQETQTLEGDICETLCNVYYAQGDYEKALKYGHRGITLYRETEDEHGQAEILNTIGDSYLALGQADEALQCFQKALELAQETGHKAEEVETLLRMGKYFAVQSRPDEAIKNLNLALDTASKLGIKRCIYECHQELANVHKNNGDFQNALVHSENFFHFYKQVFDEKEHLRIQSLEIMHQLENAQKDAEIYRLKNVALQNEIDERKKAQDALRKLAITDPLTGLFNRRYFFEIAEDACKKAKVVNPHLSVILIDVDNFKLVNDRYGHSIGDKVLIKLARLMQQSVRKVDIVARYGGEEFVILLPDTGLDQARDVAERLRSTIETQVLRINHYEIHLGISVGIALFNDQCDMNFETLLNRADMSMYEAKQAGGNRVHIWGVVPK